MPNSLTVRRLFALAFCLCAGCAVSPGAKKSSAALTAGETAANTDGSASGASAALPSAPGGTNPQAAASSSQSPASGNPANGARAGAPSGSLPSAPDPRVLDDVLAQIAELGPIEPQAQKRLIDDLRKTDPAYWPMLVQTFRASLEYRRRSAQKAAEAAQPAQASRADAGQPEIVQVAANEPVDAQDPRAVEKPAPATKAPPAPVAAATTPVATPVNSPVVETSRAAATPTATTIVPANGPASSDWRRHLDAAIAELERHTREHPGDTDALVKQVHLRLLDLAAGRRDDALKPIAALPPGDQDYWAKQIFALSTYLDQGSGDPSRRAAEASLHLARAMAALGEQAPLVVHNLAFCTDVHSYGVLKRFEPAEFHAGQQVLLYAEIENFKSEETAQGFHTSLEASYEIHDRQGQRVAHDDLSLTEEHCQNRRRDFFVRYFITLPKNIYEGGYTLDLTIEDKLGRKINQSSIDFSVKAK